MIIQWPPLPLVSPIFTNLAGFFPQRTVRTRQQESPSAWTQEAYRPPRSHSNFFLFLWVGGGVPWQNFFSQSEHVSSQIWCQKFFPLLGGRGSLDKNLFPQSEHVSSQIWCQNFFPLLGGRVPRQKIFFPIWTCIKPNLVSKFFPLLGGGVPRQKFFSGLNMYQAKSGVKNFSLYWDWGPPQKKSETRDPPKNLRLGTPQKSETGTPPKNWDQVPSPENLRPGRPSHPWLDLVPPLPGPRLGTPPFLSWIKYPPTWTWTWDTPTCRGVDWHTKWKYNLPHPLDVGGNNLKMGSIERTGTDTSFEYWLDKALWWHTKVTAWS